MAGKGLLNKHHLLDSRGRIAAPKTEPKDAKVQRALCDYLFGPVGEVATLADLPGKVTLDKVSGYKDFASNGIQYVCVYAADGTQVLALQVIDGPAVDPKSPGRPVIVTDGDLQAVFSYAPDYSGTRLAKHLAQEWMTQAVSLVRH